MRDECGSRLSGSKLTKLKLRALRLRADDLASMFFLGAVVSSGPQETDSFAIMVSLTVLLIQTRFEMLE